MTFSIAGRCAKSGAFGVAITTSSIAVGARCPHARASVGAVATQNITDPELGPKALDLMSQGLSARDSIDSLIRSNPFAEYRQLTAVDAHGNTASWSGKNILGTHGVSEQKDCVAAGNLLKVATLPNAMTASFAANAGEHLAERLLRALEAGMLSGGEEGPVHSAALIVYHQTSFPLVSLRVDWDDTDPIKTLRKLWEDYKPQMGAYLQRAIDPTKAPSYGVPGDP
ncbi:MAG: DUF1028 domain-containing protein [Alphaproteobacteria bacterium]|nr:DUF1028 domain-containing protein [Alphaproteobacteria bacterium]